MVDGRRTILVVGEEVDLFAALRPELAGAMVAVTWSAPTGFAETCARTQPWPWAVCGTGAIPRVAVPRQLLELPVIWTWLGAPPEWLPVSARVHARWRGLVGDLRNCLEAAVAGIRLAPNRGLLPPGGPLMLSPALEALVASSPFAVTMSPRAAGGVRRLLMRRGLPLVVRITPSGYVLEATA
ncbi:MAG: hypothetical protein NVSMB17_05000 [Candidatus Dormibacteria bacterium]